LYTVCVYVYVCVQDTVLRCWRSCEQKWWCSTTSTVS